MASQRTTPARSSQLAELKHRRAEQLRIIGEAISAIQSRLDDVRQRRTRSQLLDSVSKGLYDEVDKLAKKAPADQVTDLLLTQVNDVVKDVKDLMPADAYIQRQREFVPAGSNPEHRDVVVVMRQIRQGLERFGKQLEGDAHRRSASRDELKTVEAALALSLESNAVVDRDALRKRGVTLHEPWIDPDLSQVNPVFDFERLDSLDVGEYVKQHVQSE
jgi:type II secretory pathway pseudopilin PulG